MIEPFLACRKDTICNRHLLLAGQTEIKYLGGSAKAADFGHTKILHQIQCDMVRNDLGEA
jgi:hypothetical protein